MHRQRAEHAVGIDVAARDDRDDARAGRRLDLAGQERARSPRRRSPRRRAWRGSSSSRIASMISASVTVTISSTASRAIASGSAPTNGGVIPSARVGGPRRRHRLAGGERGSEARGRPRARRRRSARAGASALIADATPPIRPPPPTGTITTSTSGDVLDDLEPDGAGAGEHRRIVERMDERQPARGLDLVELVEQGRAIVVEHDLGAVAADRVELGARRAGRHHDDARRTDVARRPRDRLRVVAGRDRDQAARALGRRQRQHLVERAARLERAGLLEALALEPERRRRRARRSTAPTSSACDGPCRRGAARRRGSRGGGSWRRR